MMCLWWFSKAKLPTVICDSLEVLWACCWFLHLVSISPVPLPTLVLRASGEAGAGSWVQAAATGLWCRCGRARMSHSAPGQGEGPAGGQSLSQGKVLLPVVSAQTAIPTVWSWIALQGVPGNKQCSGFFQLQTSRIKAGWLFLLVSNSFNICLSHFLPPQFLFWIFSLEYGNKSVSSRFYSSDMNVSHPVNASSGS